jgi:hypothetical protein
VIERTSVTPPGDVPVPLVRMGKAIG